MILFGCANCINVCTSYNMKEVMKLHEITFENWAQKRGDVPLFLTTDDNLIFK